MFQYANPFGIAGGGVRRIIGFKAAVAIQVEIKTEVVRAGIAVVNKHRRARRQIKIGDVLNKVVADNWIPVGISVTDICQIGVSRRRRDLKAWFTDVIGRDEQRVIISPEIGGRQNVRDDLRLRGGERGIGGEPRGGGVRGGGDGITFAPRDGQKRHRHDERDGQQNQRDDERDARTGGTSKTRFAVPLVTHHLPLITF